MINIHLSPTLLMIRLRNPNYNLQGTIYYFPISLLGKRSLLRVNYQIRFELNNSSIIPMS